MKQDRKFKKILEYVKNTPWEDDSDYDTIVSQAYKVYEEIIINKDKGNTLFRICGQTGSGKTSQLLKSLEMYMNHCNRRPVVLGVRTCAKAHPFYDDLLKDVGEGKIREATNGFALKCMSYVLKLLIENGYLILLDITLLDPAYEEYILNLLNDNNYVVEYHIMAVNQEISNQFIERRYIETGREVSNSSCSYFNFILEKGLGYLIANDKKNYCYIWNAFDKEYKYHGLISNCYCVFKENRELKKELIYDEKVLLDSKYNILINKVKI